MGTYKAVHGNVPPAAAVAGKATARDTRDITPMGARRTHTHTQPHGNANPWRSFTLPTAPPPQGAACRSWWWRARPTPASSTCA